MTTFNEYLDAEEKADGNLALLREKYRAANDALRDLIMSHHMVNQRASVGLSRRTLESVEELVKVAEDALLNSWHTNRHDEWEEKNRGK